MEVRVLGEAALEIARRARGTPRVALRLLRRVRDVAAVRGSGSIDAEVAAQAMDMLDVDAEDFPVSKVFPVKEGCKSTGNFFISLTKTRRSY